MIALQAVYKDGLLQRRAGVIQVDFSATCHTDRLLLLRHYLGTFIIITMHSRDIVSLVELIFYIPTAILAIIVCSRHGFNRSTGWIYTLILCIVRIAGAICQFVSHSNHSDGVIEATIIIDSIGLSPLLLATLGMLSRL